MSDWINVANLPSNFDKKQALEIFGEMGPIKRVEVWHCQMTLKTSALIQFHHPRISRLAACKKDQTVVDRCTIKVRVVWSRKETLTTVRVSNLPLNVTEQELFNYFVPYGDIVDISFDKAASQWTDERRKRENEKKVTEAIGSQNEVAALISFARVDYALRACHEMHCSIIGGSSEDSGLCVRLVNPDSRNLKWKRNLFEYIRCSVPSKSGKTVSNRRRKTGKTLSQCADSDMLLTVPPTTAATMTGVSAAPKMATPVPLATATTMNYNGMNPMMGWLPSMYYGGIGTPSTIPTPVPGISNGNKNNSNTNNMNNNNNNSSIGTGLYSLNLNNIDQLCKAIHCNNATALSTACQLKSGDHPTIGSLASPVLSSSCLSLHGLGMISTPPVMSISSPATTAVGSMHQLPNSPNIGQGLSPNTMQSCLSFCPSLNLIATNPIQTLPTVPILEAVPSLSNIASASTVTTPTPTLASPSLTSSSASSGSSLKTVVAESSPAISSISRTLSTESAKSTTMSNDSLSSPTVWSAKQREIGDAIYHELKSEFPERVAKITGMFLSLPKEELHRLLIDTKKLKTRANQFVQLLNNYEQLL